MPLTFGDPDDIRLRDARFPRWIRPPIETEPKTYTPLTDLDREAIKVLSSRRLRSSMFDYRFIGDMVRIAKQPDATITERQRWNVWRLIYRYRRQIKDSALLVEAGRRLTRE